MSTSQTISAATSILNSLSDIRVDIDDLSSILTRSSGIEQERCHHLVLGLIKHWAIQYDVGAFVNSNMQIALHAKLLAGSLDELGIWKVE